MKKFLSMMLLMASIPCLFSCSSESDEERFGIPKKQSMLVGESFTLEYDCTWFSSNPFAAKVDNNGTITAVRVGNAEIYSDEHNISCEVTVSPSYTLYKEPITEWGMSKGNVKKEKGTPDNDSGNIILYNKNGKGAMAEMYSFENNKLKSCAIVVDASYSEKIAEHLVQRYLPTEYNEEEKYIYFIDAETYDDAKTVVAAQFYEEEDYWIIAYMKNTTTKSADNYNKLFEKFASQIEEAGI